MQSTRNFLTIRVTHPNGGCVECRVSAGQMASQGFRRAVALAAWTELLKNEKDGFGEYTHRPSSTKRILTMLIHQYGREKVFEKFCNSIEWEFTDGTRL